MIAATVPVVTICEATEGLATGENRQTTSYRTRSVVPHHRLVHWFDAEHDFAILKDADRSGRF